MNKLSVVQLMSLSLVLVSLTACWKQYEVAPQPLQVGECSYEGSGFNTSESAAAEANRLSALINGGEVAGEKTYVTSIEVWDKYHAKKGQKDRIEGYAYLLKFTCGALAFKSETHYYANVKSRDAAYEASKEAIMENALNIILEDDKGTTSADSCQRCNGPKIPSHPHGGGEGTSSLAFDCNCVVDDSYGYTLRWIEKNPQHLKQVRIIDEIQALSFTTGLFSSRTSDKLTTSLKASLRVLPEATEQYQASHDILGLLEKAEARPRPRFTRAQ
ncbi:MAG: hypothetical protein EOP09_20680 [Proteobacteria bacterium]|nr:MAG: hypothetical protein EOP09_20680 [Pseudomonadota bacterium]